MELRRSLLTSASPGRWAMVPAPIERSEVWGHDNRSENLQHLQSIVNVELSLPIFRLALAVFIPWRGADGFDRRAGWHPR